MDKQQQTDFLISYTVDKLTEFLIDDHGMTIPDALKMIYSSRTYQKLTETENGLYSQSPSYVYEMFEEENDALGNVKKINKTP